MINKLLNVAINASLKAGQEVLKVYDSDFAVKCKEDESPITEADTNSHKIIMQALISSPYPILSEEGKVDNFEMRSTWKTLWVVDPLDGTKEFVKRNGDFTINIALVENGEPILGVIYVPVSKTLYYGTVSDGSFRVKDISYNNISYSSEELTDRSVSLPINTPLKNHTIAVSRTHFSSETEKYIEASKKEYGKIDTLSRGSSLKICMVAEGLVNEYPRCSPTMEWDTAAGHAIVKYAGFNIYDFENNTQLKYNKPNLLNSWFIVK